MPYSLDLLPKSTESLRQMQRLIMSRQMQQAIHLLQMPVMELSLAIDSELEQNPVLELTDDGDGSENELGQSDHEMAIVDDLAQDAKPESELQFDSHDFETLLRLDEDFRGTLSETGGANGINSIEQEKLQNFLEGSIVAEETLFEHLLKQANEVFEDKIDVSFAEEIIGNFDQNGFLTTPLQEISILRGCNTEKLEALLATIQTFHPPGVGARSLKESLLIQLRLQGKADSLAYSIVETHFDDLLHNRIPAIKKGLGCTSDQIKEMVDFHIVKLDLHPGMCFSKRVNTTVVPDVLIRQEGDQLFVSVNEDCLTPLRLNKRYLSMLDDKTLRKEDKDFIRQKVISAKWLIRNIFQRNTTIERIAIELAKRQKTFFLEPDGKLVPLTMRAIAEELELHDSTIARAVSQKYIDTPRGLLPLRYFFTSAIGTDGGEELSSRSVKDIIEKLIKEEDKQHPLSDESIAAIIQAKGIQCARRTVAKYRSVLKIGSSQQRRQF